MLDVLEFHKKYSPAELEQQYNNRAGRPDFESTVVPDWVRRSDAARASLDCTLDIQYGQGVRQKLDVFRSREKTAPTLVFFHGGYWQRGEKSLYEFIAQPYSEAGVSVVFIGYDLCPAVTVTQISEQAREAIAYVWRNAAELGVSTDRLIVIGHSAGGHITEMMMATDWSAYASDLPANLILSGIPVSPVSLLEPVRLTQSINAELHMDAAEAQAQSPIINHPPCTNASQLVVVGGAESDEFLRQAKMYQDAFCSDQRQIELYIAPDVDHFDVLNTLTAPSSELFQKILKLLFAASE